MLNLERTIQEVMRSVERDAPSFVFVIKTSERYDLDRGSDHLLIRIEPMRSRLHQDTSQGLHEPKV